MSNKPKIHAFCDAGCKWETVHKDEVVGRELLFKAEDKGGLLISPTGTNTSKPVFTHTESLVGKTLEVWFYPSGTVSNKCLSARFKVLESCSGAFYTEVLQEQTESFALRIGKISIFADIIVNQFRAGASIYRYAGNNDITSDPFEFRIFEVYEVADIVSIQGDKGDKGDTGYIEVVKLV